MSERARIVPQQSGAAPLDLVIAVMAFLAALTLGASLIAGRAAEGWSAGLSGRITVQILPPQDGPAEDGLAKETAAALAVLQSTQGIAFAKPVSKADTEKLVQPWLGTGALVADLPLPRLIDVTLDPGVPLDLPRLRERLKNAAPDSVVDDHSHWKGRLAALAETVMWSAYAILALIAVATAAAVTFATRASLETHRKIVELLHQMGAHSGFVARAFEWHYFISALMAATTGATLAALGFLAAGGLEMAGVEPVPFLPPLSLEPKEILWLVAVPVGSASIAWATARLSVLAALRRIY